MSNIVSLHPTRRASITAHRVTFDIVPRDVKERLFNAAIAVGLFDEYFGTCVTGNEEADERMAELVSAASVAAQYTVPVQIEVDEPIAANEEAQ